MKVGRMCEGESEKKYLEVRGERGNATGAYSRSEKRNLSNGNCIDNHEVLQEDGISMTLKFAWRGIRELRIADMSASSPVIGGMCDCSIGIGECGYREENLLVLVLDQSCCLS